jgi:hypothetical protein
MQNILYFRYILIIILLVFLLTIYYLILLKNIEEKFDINQLNIDLNFIKKTKEHIDKL